MSFASTKRAIQVTIQLSYTNVVIAT